MDPIEYELKRRRGQRTIRACVYAGGRVRVSAGMSISVSAIDAFVERHREWIESAIHRAKDKKPGILEKQNRKEYLANKEIARRLAKERLEYFNQVYGLKWKRIAIKQGRSQWGSCSRLGNLNFNYKIALIPSELADYVIVHELCHLKEMNHSKRYWDLVAKAIPDWRKKRAQLRAL
ncbi:M48 family metallopeptidase [Candidatus Uhrbacteria bacterium]|nr:M48 family metallopeptidase [Candidatus Uhrbacteria bacterium]